MSTKTQGGRRKPASRGARPGILKVHLALTAVLLFLLSAPGLSHAETMVFASGIDGYIYDYQNGASHTYSGNYSAAQVGFGRSYSGATRNTKQLGLLRFYGQGGETSIFGDAPGQIPLGATITSATLKVLTSDRVGLSRSLYRMNVDWNTGTTWNNILGGPALTAGLNMEALPDLTWLADDPALHAEAASYYGWYFREFDVLASLQAWAAGDDYFGWGIWASNVSSLTNGYFYSFEGANLTSGPLAGSSTKPLLMVEFSLPVQAMPEPGTVVLLGIGLAGAVAVARRRKS